MERLNKKMNIAIVGSSGYISSFLIRSIQSKMPSSNIIKIDMTKDADVFLELEHAEAFDYECLKDVDFVVFTAAVSGPDKCAEDFDYCWKVNVEGTRTFIREALGRNCRVIFFSSDAVFGDIPGEIYTENSDTKAETPYGRMKKAVEDMFRENRNFKAIRLSYVMSLKDRFVSYCMECLENGKKAEVFHPFYRNVISVTDVVNVNLWLMDHWDELESSVLNVAGKELVSRVRIADEINRLTGNRLKYEIITPDEQFYRNRPKITQMKSIYISAHEIIKDDSFTEKIRAEFERGK